MATKATWPMPCCKRSGIIQKEQLRPAIGRHDLTASVFVVQNTGNPVLYSVVFNDLLASVMDDTPVTCPRAPFWGRHERAKWVYSIL